MTYEEKVQAYREAMTDAVRTGLGFAAQLVDQYAAETPLAEPYCADIATRIRELSAGLNIERQTHE